MHGIIRLDLPADPKQLSCVRCFIERAGSEVLGALELGEFQTAVGEAATNAMLHGCLHPLDRVRIMVVIAEGEIFVDVEDDGPGFEVAATRLPDPVECEEHGYGVTMIRTFGLGRWDRGGTRCRLRRKAANGTLSHDTPSPRPRPLPPRPPKRS